MLPNSYQNWLRWSLDQVHRNYWMEFWYSFLFKSYDYVNLTMLTQNQIRCYISAKLWSFKTKLYAYSTPWSEGTCEVMRSKKSIFAHNFWNVYQNYELGVCVFLGSCQIRQYQFCQDRTNRLSAILKFDINCDLFIYLF